MTHLDTDAQVTIRRRLHGMELHCCGRAGMTASATSAMTTAAGQPAPRRLALHQWAAKPRLRGRAGVIPEAAKLVKAGLWLL
ncbi:MAG: hypothetical protein M3319_15645 [Actinomycetota bacterium]|nr:hypothetical protein [Actinomycetota bacterium]MDQ3901806.1 hypothetical protein [Actinomycetota bacterium]